MREGESTSVRINIPRVVCVIHKEMLVILVMTHGLIEVFTV